MRAMVEAVPRLLTTVIWSNEEVMTTIRIMGLRLESLTVIEKERENAEESKLGVRYGNNKRVACVVP